MTDGAAISADVGNNDGGRLFVGRNAPIRSETWWSKPVPNRHDMQLTRRGIFALVASLALAGTAPALAAGVPIRAIRVTGRANRELARLAPLVAEQLASQLGPRYVPGARGGATLSVELTGINLPVNTGGDRFFRHFGGSVDVLEGNIAMIGPRGAALQSFPLLASNGSIDASDIYLEATPARLSGLAYAYAHWVVSKLD